MKPADVDALPIVDFLILVDGVKARLESRERGLEKSGIWIA